MCTNKCISCFRWSPRHTLPRTVSAYIDRLASAASECRAFNTQTAYVFSLLFLFYFISFRDPRGMPKRKYAIKKLNMQSEVGEEQKYPPTTPTVEVKHKERAFLVLFLLKKKRNTTKLYNMWKATTTARSTRQQANRDQCRYALTPNSYTRVFTSTYGECKRAHLHGKTRDSHEFFS